MFRFPDKPMATTAGFLETLCDGDYLAEMKYDGWRALIRWDGRSLSLTSRHREPIPASTGLVSALRELVEVLPPVLLDGEWLGRRDGQPESLWLFDVLERNGLDWYGQPAQARWSELERLFWRHQNDRVSVVEMATGGYREFFELSKTRPGCEGIVLKHRNSRYVGSVRKCIDNPEWFKVKWRDGADGHVLVA